MIFIVMGVSGCGKSSIGKRLANALSVSFYDADDFHSESSIRKMSNGIPLDDNDRLPWLQRLAGEMLQWNKNGGAVLACSALKQKYRDILSSGLPEEVKFVYLKGDKSVIAKRLNSRKPHFMGASLLNSQFDTLEEPTDAIVVPIKNSPKQIINEILEGIRS